LTVKLLTSTII